jgi:nitric oxide reductase subunit B
MQMLRWMRVPGDILFALGAALMGWFVLGLLTGHTFSKQEPDLNPAARKTVAEQEAVLAGR